MPLRLKNAPMEVVPHPDMPIWKYFVAITPPRPMSLLPATFASAAQGGVRRQGVPAGSAREPVRLSAKTISPAVPVASQY